MAAFSMQRPSENGCLTSWLPGTREYRSANWLDFNPTWQSLREPQFTAGTAQRAKAFGSGLVQRVPIISALRHRCLRSQDSDHLLKPYALCHKAWKKAA